MSATEDRTTLYIRAVPAALVREAKAVAARQGKTLTALVVGALDDLVRREASRNAPQPDALSEDRAWYEANKRRLLSRYRGEYVAIAERKVVDHDAEFGSLSKRVFERFGTRPVLMPRCVPGERVVAVRSPRVARK